MKKASKNSSSKQVKHIIPRDHRRNERKTNDLLKHADQVEEWDDLDIDLGSREQRYHKRQTLE